MSGLRGSAMSGSTASRAPRLPRRSGECLAECRSRRRSLRRVPELTQRFLERPEGPVLSKYRPLYRLRSATGGGLVGHDGRLLDLLGADALLLSHLVLLHVRGVDLTGVDVGGDRGSGCGRLGGVLGGVSETHLN